MLELWDHVFEALGLQIGLREQVFRVSGTFGL